MRSRLTFLVLLPVAASGCAQGGGSYPSLQPRAAELVDPRLPVRDGQSAPLPPDPALVAELQQLFASALAGEAAFNDAAARAQRLVAAAGAPRSEGWIAAQQAISAAIAAREPTALALGQVDSLAASRLARSGWIPPADRAAIETAAAQIAALSDGQVALIEAMEARLGAN